MALPTTGDTWANILQKDLNPLEVRKGIITDILIGDYIKGGVANNLSATAAGLNSNGVFTPFAADGQIRSDLLIGSNAGQNLGLFHIGLLKDDGWTFTPSLTVDKTPVAQSPWSVRNDTTSKTGEVMFTARQWFPLLSYLQMELPTLDPTGNFSVVPDAGTAGYSLPAPAYQNLCERWIIALGVDGSNLFAYTFPRVSTSKLGKMAANKKDPLDREFNFEVLLDPNTGSPYIESAGGSAWAGLGGVPIPGTVVATPVTGLKVTLTFPLSGLDVQNATFSATKTTGGTTTALTLQGSPSISTVGGVKTVTLTGTSLTASTSYTGLITVTGDNNATATAAIPSFTSTAS
jgi:hypothetical protein